MIPKIYTSETGSIRVQPYSVTPMGRMQMLLVGRCEDEKILVELDPKQAREFLEEVKEVIKIFELLEK